MRKAVGDRKNSLDKSLLLDRLFLMDPNVWRMPNMRTAKQFECCKERYELSLAIIITAKQFELPKSYTYSFSLVVIDGIFSVFLAPAFGS